METAIENQKATEAMVINQNALATTGRVAALQAKLNEETEIRALVANFIEEHMVEGVDYGIIPGTPEYVEISIQGQKRKFRKNNLLKPGAEKLFGLFSCRPEYDFLMREVDRESGLYSYEMRCRAISLANGEILTEGVGSGSSYESRYRYRNSDRLCPNCGMPRVKKCRPPRKGWYCFERMGGCGAFFGENDTRISSQKGGKMMNPDLADMQNTVLKIAKKRSQVDCAHGLATVSDLFTQDMEDIALPENKKNQSEARADALWIEAKERLGKPKAEERWKEAQKGFPKKKADWKEEHFNAMALALFPEEASESDPTGETPPDSSEPPDEEKGEGEGAPGGGE